MTILCLAITLFTIHVNAQYAPAAGMPGSTAMYKDSSAFKAWATGCTLQRAWQDIADTTLGYVTVGDETSAIGKAGTNGIVSLGDGGVATLTFAEPIYNGQGADFAVFENGFTTGPGLAFLEFGFVEVSSDGVNFVRFPAISHIQDTTQMAMEGIDCSLVHNLAGKYVNGYGTPFDLEELANEPNLDINRITHVRIIDVVGSIDPAYATYDSEGHKVNDPYPTPFPSSGFDLDAVGAINVLSTGVNEVNETAFSIYPNPANDVLHVALNKADSHCNIVVTDLSGRQVYLQSAISNLQSEINISSLNTGIYIVSIQSNKGVSTTKLVKE